MADAPYRCNECPGSPAFPSPGTLRYHQRQHPKPQDCGCCKMRFATPLELEQHNREHHVSLTARAAETLKRGGPSKGRVMVVNGSGERRD